MASSKTGLRIPRYALLATEDSSQTAERQPHTADSPGGLSTVNGAKHNDNLLCELCRKAFQGIFKHLQVRGQASIKQVVADLDTVNLDHHTSWADLDTSAVQGCPLCRLFKSSIGPPDPVQLHAETASSIDFFIDELDTDVAPVDKCLVSMRYNMLQEWPAFEIAANSDDVDFLPARAVSEMPDLGMIPFWMEKCLSCHKTCPSLGVPGMHNIPTRLIDVGPSKDKESPRLRLTTDLRSHEISSGVKYVALTHCWGQDRISTITTADTVERHLEAIPFNDMPRNFQDAVQVTRALGYRYLWIDSLCIVQGDPAEWQIECMKMHMVYSNASLTLAAAGASNAYAGFLNKRPQTGHFQASFSFESPSLGNINVSVRQLNGYGQSLLEKQYPPVLDERAWAYQEYHLSPRILSFGTRQMYFQCASSIWYERSRYPTAITWQNISKPSWLADMPSTPSEVQDASSFYDLAEDFSGRDLTYGDDRLPAISAIARRYQLATGDTYLAGIWKGDAVRGLLWSRSSIITRALHPPRQQAPSWSWASSATDVSFRYTRREEFTAFEPLVEVVSVTAVPIGLDPLGQCSYGEIQLLGSAREFDMNSLATRTSTTQSLDSEEDICDIRSIGKVILDERQNWFFNPTSKRVLVLPLAKCVYYSGGPCWLGMLLQKFDKGELRRVGFLKAFFDHPYSVPAKKSLERILAVSRSIYCIV